MVREELIMSFPPRIKYGVNFSGNPVEKTPACPCLPAGRGRQGIPDQVRNDVFYKVISETVY